GVFIIPENKLLFFNEESRLNVLSP
ncbi:hypothetical protein LCGC14_0577910, partial [marine sediment metagenome]